MKKVKLIVFSTVAIAAFGFYEVTESDLFFKINRGIDLFGKVYKEISLNYVEEVDPEKFIHSGIDGMLKTLDPYTVYIGEDESDEIDLVTTGKYGGVGITIGVRDGAVTVVNLLEGFSAAKQGIEIGDKIMQIDTTTVAGSNLDAIRQIVRGAPGTELRMKIEREGEPKPLEFVLMREEIPVRNVTYAGFAEPNIGYVRLERFSRSAGEDVRNAIKELKSQRELKGLVFDLRDNPGGLLDIAVEITSKFLPESSLVVSTRGRKSDSERKYYSTEKPMLPDVPLVLLVNSNTASASEIVAGAVQDLDRGIVLGTRTFGKGLVQTMTRLSERSVLKITSARYYTPSGRCIQEIDYAHRSKDGIFPTFPDSLKREFHTAHNRRVFEAGGIVPDTLVTDERDSKLIVELYRKAMFFKFANHYASSNKSISPNFDVSDSLLNAFDRYLKEKKFAYQEEGELKLKELSTIAEDGRYNKAFVDELKQLQTMVEQEKQRQVERFRNEIREALRTEILARIKGDKARIESTFATDTQLRAAISVVKNKKVYEKLLAGRKK
jgi:carboxyl-terminal processing protease